MAHTGKCFAIETGIDKLLVNDHRKMNENIIRFQTFKQDRKAENKIKKIKERRNTTRSQAKIYGECLQGKKAHPGRSRNFKKICTSSISVEKVLSREVRQSHRRDSGDSRFNE